MKLCEIRQVKPVKTKSPLQKKPVAKYAKTSGAGAHTSTNILAKKNTKILHKTSNFVLVTK